MASNNGYLTHCRICGTPIFSLGNRQFCSACYAQNRRNAAHRSNAEAKMRREQAKREEEKMKASNKTVTSAQELAMRAKLSEMGGISYGELSLWEMSHGLEFSAWEHEWESSTVARILTAPSSRTICRKGSRSAVFRRSILGFIRLPAMANHRKKYKRSEDYRYRYVLNHPGTFGKFYMCPYCGRIMTRNSMQVDHIISINLANEHRAYRILVPNDDINNIRNLTASCPECNNRKSDSGGGWIFLGRFGKYIFILIWAILLLSCLAFVLCCMSGTLKRGFLIPYVADIANVLLHWFADTIAQMFRVNT